MITPRSSASASALARVTPAVTPYMNRRLYAVHRWLSLAILAQFAVWLCSGLFFASFPIAEVRGEHVDAPPTVAIDDGAALVSPATALGISAQLGFGPVEALELRVAAGRPVYLARGPHHAGLRLDARTGTRFPVERGEAEAVARHDQRGEPSVRGALLVDADPPIEYRERPLPAWCVSLDDGKSTNVWVDARTGEVTARRNDRWRQYDFLWSLHIMDYRERESFHHPLLIVAAALGLLTIVSGVTLWGLRLARWRRRRAKESAVPT